MAYAKIAGLSPVYGFYASFSPLYVYALFGTSRQLSVGPVAIVSLLTKTGLAPLVSPVADPVLYTKLAILLSFLIGVFQTLMGLLRMGWLVSFLSYPVISGFTGGSAIIICLSQLRNLMGFQHSAGGGAGGGGGGGHSAEDASVWSHFEGLAHFNPVTTALGVLWLGLLLLFKNAPKWDQRLFVVKAAGPFVVLLASSGACWAFDLHGRFGVAITGEVPAGLPPVSTDWVFSYFWQVVPTAGASGLSRKRSSERGRDSAGCAWLSSGVDRPPGAASLRAGCGQLQPPFLRFLWKGALPLNCRLAAPLLLSQSHLRPRRLHGEHCHR